MGVLEVTLVNVRFYNFFWLNKKSYFFETESKTYWGKTIVFWWIVISWFSVLQELYMEKNSRELHEIIVTAEIKIVIALKNIFLKCIFFFSELCDYTEWNIVSWFSACNQWTILILHIWHLRSCLQRDYL